MVLKSVFLGVLDYGSIFVSSIPEEMTEELQVLQNNAIRCCLNIVDPRNANTIDIHRLLNIHLFRHRLVLNLLLCIRNAGNDCTLSMRQGEVQTRGDDGRTILLPIPRIRYIRKTPFYWGSQISNTLPLEIRITPLKTTFKKYILQSLTNNDIRLILPQ